MNANCTIDTRYHFNMFQPFGECEYPGGITLSIELEGPQSSIIIPYTRRFMLRTYHIIDGISYVVDEGFGVVDQQPLSIGKENEKHCGTHTLDFDPNPPHKCP